MEKKPKILHIIEAMGGGVFTYIVNLANGLSDEYDVTIAMGVRNETPEDYETYFNDEVNLMRVKNFSRSINPLKDVMACFELRKIVKEIKPDIIHLHSSKAGAIGRMIFSGRKYKVFYTPHGYSFFMEDIRPVMRSVYKQIEKICGMRKSKRSTYVNNGIDSKDLDDIMEYGGNCPHQEFTVYTAGRIEYQKNPEMFNEIAKRLPDVKFVWIGEGSMRDCLTSENIEITGWIERAHAIKLAEKGDVFLFPSRWEGLPIALLEAMYMKKVCMASDVVGNRDIVENGVTGYICNTVDEFAELIENVRNKKVSNLGDKAHKLVVDEYNSNSFCDNYKKIYRNN